MRPSNIQVNLISTAPATGIDLKNSEIKGAMVWMI